MPDKPENAKDKEMTLATADGDWTTQMAMLLLLALFASWGSVPNTDEDRQ